MSRIIIILCISVYCHNLILAQDLNPTFDRITVEDGLSIGRINYIYQDSKGYMWFCTPSGLNKYDGYNFTVYKHDKDDSTTICGDYITNIFELNDKAMLVATANGISVYDHQLNTFSVLEAIVDGKKKLFNNITVEFCKISSDTLLFYTYKYGIWLYNIKNKTAELFLDEFIAPYPSTEIFHLRKDSKNKLWIGTNNQGLIIYDFKQHKIKEYLSISDDPSSISKSLVTCTYEDIYRNIWVGTDNGLYLFDPEKEIFTHFKYNPSGPGEKLVGTIHEDSRKRLWIGFTCGLSLYNNSTNQFQTFENNPLNPNSLSENHARCMFNDNHGSLWIGTPNEGICKLDYNKAPFNYFVHLPENSNSLSNETVTAIHEDKYGNLYIGVYGEGLNYYNRKTGIFSHYMHDPNDPNSIGSNYIQGLEIDHNGNVWMATWGGDVVNHFNPATRKFKACNLHKSATEDIDIAILFEDIHHNLWMGSTGKGVLMFNIKTGEFKVFKNIKGDTTSISNSNIWGITKDNDNNIWIATNSGLNKFISETNTFKQYFNSEVNLQGFNCIYWDNDSFLWLGNGRRELIKFDPKTEKSTCYSKEDGLGDSYIFSIIKNPNGNLWLNTSNGLYWFHPEKGVIKKFNEKNGYPITYSEYGASTLLSTGEIALGSTKGFVLFHPDSIRLNEHIPPVVITDFEIFNKPIKPGADGSPLSKHISYTKSIVLDHKQSVFSLRFAALDYAAPERNQYAYYLEGFEKDWNYVDNKREASYTNLDPGSYVFKVKAANNDGIWNEEGTSLYITILPPWWGTWWFRSIIVIFIVSILISIYLLRVNTLKKQKVILEQKVKERTKKLLTANEELESKNIEIESINKKLEEKDKYKTDFFHNITHEFKTPLTLMKGNIEMILDGYFGKINKQVKKQLQVAKINSVNLNDYINQILELAKIDAKQIKVKIKKYDLIAFLKSVYTAFTPLARTKNITLDFEPPCEEMSVCFDSAKLEIILNNLLSNAIKYSKENSHISILLKEHDDEFTIAVSDTGIGIPKHQLPHIFERFRQLDSGLTRKDKGAGIGLALVKEYVYLLQGSITVDSEHGKGSVFAITFNKDLRKSDLKSLIQMEDDIHYGKEIVEYDFPLIQEEEESGSFDGNNKDATILIVEDNEDMLNFMKQILTDKYNVLEACDGMEGYEVCKRELPDIVISDVMMPNIDGFGLCKAIVENETTSHIPVILLSANADEKFQHRGLKQGAISYITKPFDPGKLLLQTKNQLRYILQRQIKNWNLITKNTGKITTVYTGDTFLKKVHAIVLENMHEESFGVEDFAKIIGISRTHLHRKMKSVTGKSSGVFIRSIRLLEAKAMIENSDNTNLTMAEIAFKVGFSEPASFTKAFKKQFGINPSKLD